MSHLIPTPNPTLPRPPSGNSIEALVRFDSVLIVQLQRTLSDLARAVNALAPLDSIADTPHFPGQIAVSGGEIYIAQDTTAPGDWIQVSP